MLLYSSKTASQSSCQRKLLPGVDTKNYLISLAEAVSGVVSPTTLVLELFKPFLLHFPAVFGLSGTSFGDPQRTTFYTSIRSDLPDKPGSTGVMTDPERAFFER